MIKYMFLGLLTVAPMSCFHRGNIDEVQTSQDLQSGLLLLHLRGKVSPKQVEGAYQRYHLEPFRSMVERENSWVFRFDTSLISTQEIVDLLDDSQFVSKAELFKD